MLAIWDEENRADIPANIIRSVSWSRSGRWLGNMHRFPDVTAYSLLDHEANAKTETKETGFDDQSQGQGIIRHRVHAPSFSTLIFHDFSMIKKWKSAQHIFPSKRYTTYECIPELVLTVPSARSTIVKKIKRFIIWLYKWSCVTFYRIAQCSSRNSMTLSSFSMTSPWPLLFSMTLQAWKMVFLNSMTLHDQGAPCNTTSLDDLTAFITTLNPNALRVCFPDCCATCSSSSLVYA